MTPDLQAKLEELRADLERRRKQTAAAAEKLSAAAAARTAAWEVYSKVPATHGTEMMYARDRYHDARSQEATQEVVLSGARADELLAARLLVDVLTIALGDA